MEAGIIGILLSKNRDNMRKSLHSMIKAGSKGENMQWKTMAPIPADPMQFNGCKTGRPFPGETRNEVINQKLLEACKAALEALENSPEVDSRYWHNKAICDALREAIDDATIQNGK